jgi:hypothetical protein
MVYGNYGGNIEVTPSLGPSKPFGRIVVGSNAEPWLKEFFKRQCVQTPLLEVDVEVLGLGHVDEIVTFLPCSTGGYKVVIGSPQTGIDELRRLKQGDFPDLSVDPDEIQAEQQVYINLIDTWIKGPIGQSLGLSDTAFVGIPAFFNVEGHRLPSGDPNKYTSNPINMLVLGSHAVVPDPFGQFYYYGERNGIWYCGEDLSHDGKLTPDEDENGNGTLEEHFFLKEFTRGQLMQQVWVTAHFIDCMAYHTSGGEIHCATNCTREQGDGP